MIPVNEERAAQLAWCSVPWRHDIDFRWDHWHLDDNPFYAKASVGSRKMQAPRAGNPKEAEFPDVLHDIVNVVPGRSCAWASSVL